MDIKKIKAVLNIIAALSAFAAAALWYKASVVVVRPSGGEDKDGWESAQITVSHESTGEFDPFATGIAQSKWNKWAATAAAVAAFVQGIVLLFPD